jgi:hypothetical protein
VRREAVCTGPAHAEPTVLPLDSKHWYFHKSGPMKGKPVSRCKACANWSKLVNPNGPHGLVPVKPVWPLLAELIDRCGSIGAVERLYGIRTNVIQNVLRHQARMQKRTAQRILAALSEQRKLDRQSGSTNERYRSKRIAEAVREHKMTESYVR